MIFISLTVFSLVSYYMLKRLTKWNRLIIASVLASGATQLTGLAIEGELDPLMPIAIVVGFFAALCGLILWDKLFGGRTGAEP